MRKSRPHKRIIVKPTEKYRFNEKILSPSVFVIDEQGESLGIMPTEQAISRARERELDLIEVNPKADPPVAKIINYGKFQYQQEKLAKKQKAKNKKIDIKGIRLSLRIGQHDLEIRRKQALDFLEEGNKIKVEMILRGRERQYLQLARKVFNDFIASFGASIKIEVPFSAQEGRLTMLLAPHHK